jgi:NAD(P)-dependent dehydrogenase (short-subunit alcohol dehydrogenase family)
MELWVISGVSRGLGAAIAAQVLAPERHVIGISRTGNHELVKAAASHGAIYEDVHLSLADLAATERRFTALLASLPSKLTRAVLINNAGVVEPIGVRSAMAADELARAINVNLGAALLLSSCFIAATQHAERRQVLNISSGAARRPIAGWMTYCSTKAAIDMLTRCINLEHAGQPNPVHAVSLAPGVIDTDMQANIRTAPKSDFPDVDRFLALKSEGKLASSEDAATKVLDYLETQEFGVNEIDSLQYP